MATETPASTPTTVQTPQTTASLRGRVGNAETIVPLPVGENQYFAVREIPDEPPDRLAFVGANSTLLDPQGTVDVAVAYAGRGYSTNSTDRLAGTREAYSQFETAGATARAANIAAELSGALALAVDPTASASHPTEAVQDAVTWGTTDVSEPYREAFNQLSATTSSLMWADEHVSQSAQPFRETDTGAIGVGQTMPDASGAISGLDDVASSAKTVKRSTEQADSILRQRGRCCGPARSQRSQRGSRPLKQWVS